MIAHYKNGREAKNGDRVLWSPPYRQARIAPLYDVEPDSSSGHAKFVTEDPLPLYVNLKECLHLDDALAAQADAADPIVALRVEPKASPPPTTPTSLRISQQLAELQGADPNVVVKSLTSMMDTLAAQADAAIGDATTGSRPIDVQKLLPGEVPQFLTAQEKREIYGVLCEAEKLLAAQKANHTMHNTQTGKEKTIQLWDETTKARRAIPVPAELADLLEPCGVVYEKLCTWMGGIPDGEVPSGGDYVEMRNYIFGFIIEAFHRGEKLGASDSNRGGN